MALHHSDKPVPPDGGTGYDGRQHPGEGRFVALEQRRVGHGAAFDQRFAEGQENFGMVMFVHRLSGKEAPGCSASERLVAEVKRSDDRANYPATVRQHGPQFFPGILHD